LAIYETVTGKQQGVIRIGADNIRFACGREVVIVALPEQRILQSYNLKTRERVKSAPFPSANPLKDLRMGNDSTGQLYAQFGADLIAIDAATLLPMKLRGPALPIGHNMEYRVSADGSTVTTWDPGISPSSFHIATVRNGGVSLLKSPEGFSMGNRRFTPTANRSLILYETQVYNSGAKAIDSTLKGYDNFIPTADPRFIIAVHEGEQKRSDLAICAATDRRVLVKFQGVSNVGDTAGYDRGRCGIVQGLPGAGEPRIVYRPDAKMLALIPLTNDRIELLPANLTGTAPGAANAALAVISVPPAEIGVGERGGSSFRLPRPTTGEEVHDGKEDAGAEERCDQPGDAEVISVDGPRSQQWRDQKPAKHRAHNADDYIQNDPLLLIGFHDHACEPANDAADDEPNDQAHEKLLRERRWTADRHVASGPWLRSMLAVLYERVIIHGTNKVPSRFGAGFTQTPATFSAR